MPMDYCTEEVLKKCCSLEAINGLSMEEKELLVKQASLNDRLQCNNKFLGHSDQIKFFTFNLPRMMTCPGKTNICSFGCYQEIAEEMLKGEDRDSQVLYSRKLNWFLAEQNDFVQRILKEIFKWRPKYNQKIIVRIHASGDFYSETYLKKWMKIALITKLMNKNYSFVAYTKSFTELDNVLGNQEELKNIFKEAYDYVGSKAPILNNLTLTDFNLNIIASYMDDTEENDKDIATKWDLPVYYVTGNENQELFDCEEKPCAECLKCYTFPMDMVITKLRKLKGKK